MVMKCVRGLHSLCCLLLLVSKYLLYSETEPASLALVSFPSSSDGKASAHNAGDLGSIPGLGRSPGEGKGYPLQYSSLENSMDCRVWGHKESYTTKQLSRPHANKLNNLDESDKFLGKHKLSILTQ